MTPARLTTREFWVALGIAIAYWSIAQIWFVGVFGIGSIELVLAANAATAVIVLAIAGIALKLTITRKGRVAFLSVLLVWLVGAIFNSAYFHIASGCSFQSCVTGIALGILFFPFVTLMATTLSASWPSLVLVSVGVPLIAFFQRPPSSKATS